MTEVTGVPGYAIMCENVRLYLTIETGYV